MATTYATAVTRLRARVRQVGSIALDNDDAIYLLSMCQQHVNIALRSYVLTTTLTTLAEKQLYSLADDLSNALDVIAVEESDRALLRCAKLQDFSALDYDWFRNITATRFEAWHQISRDYLIVYPAKATASSVKVTYIPYTAIYSDYTTYSSENMLLPDEDIELVIKLAELIALTRSRDSGLIEKTLKRAIDLFGAKNVSIQSTNP